MHRAQTAPTPASRFRPRFATKPGSGAPPNPAVMPLYKKSYDAAWSQESAVPDRASLPGNGRFWTIHNKRYDLTSFVDHHPAGRRMILLGQGRNCTELFETYHSLTSSKPRELLGKYYVEDAAPGDIDYFDDFEWTTTPFFSALKERVRAHFRNGRISHKYKPARWAFTGLMGLISLIALLGFFRGEWWAVIALPIAYWLGPSPWLHDGCHFSISKSVFINDFFAALGSGLSSKLAWDHQHTVGHHVRTNLVAGDPDLTTPLLRNSAVFDWHPAYQKTRFRLFLRCVLTTFGSCFIRDVASARQQRRGPIHYARLSDSELALYYLGRLAIFVPICVVPFFLFPLWKAVVFTATPWIIHGHLYYWFSQVSHITSECVSLHEPVAKKIEFAAHQVQETHDYAQTSWLWAQLSNGLNNQTIHHVFPQVDSSHYADLYPIFKETCANFGVPYTESPDFFHACKLHLRHLDAVNSKPH